MRRFIPFIIFSLPFLLQCQNNHSKTQVMNNQPNKLVRSEEEWKKILTPEQYYVLRQKGTEPPFSGKYYMHFEKGVYKCAACGYELFTSDMKFESHCGWPSFDNEIGHNERIIKKPDYSYGMIRTEILCVRCGSHLGHLFDDGPTSTGKRYCVNSLSIEFEPANDNHSSTPQK